MYCTCIVKNVICFRQTRRSGETSGADKAELETIYDKKSPRRMRKKTEAEERELKLWMKQKHAKQLKEYLQQVEEKRQREAHPFTTSSKSGEKTVSCSRLRIDIYKMLSHVETFSCSVCTMCLTTGYFV